MAPGPTNFSMFSRLIKSLLLEHNRVSLPGIGSFVAENQSSELLENGRIINPPARVVTFSVKESWNDEWLERAYAAELEKSLLEIEDGEGLTQEQLEEKKRHTSKLFLEQSKREISQFTALVMSQLQNEGVFQFPEFGNLRVVGKREEIVFEKAPECDLSPQGFGLSPLSIKPLPSASRLTESPLPQIETQRQPNRQIEEVVIRQKEVQIDRKRERVPNRDKPVRSFKWVYICLGIILLIIALFVLTYIFKDDLMPLLKKILYSAEDRPYVDILLL
ncbi:MAG: hypothetical protein LBC84_07140 [Prevotellaceae bacterium]|jgi:nucleoid DNA-binding protein|nr:hypothetical protein [Prevotellaceae bacterium]